MVEKKLDFERKRTLVAKQVTAARRTLGSRQGRVRPARSRRSIAPSADVARRRSRPEAQRDQPRQGLHLLADRWRRAQPQCRSRPDGRILAAGAGPLHDRRRPDEDGAAGRRRRGRRRQGQGGPAATFTVDAYPDRKFPARIRELRYGSEIVQGVVTYKAVLTTDNAELLLRPGMTATAEIIVQEV